MRYDYLTSGTIVAVAVTVVASRGQAIAALAVLYLLVLAGFGTWKLWRDWRSR